MNEEPVSRAINEWSANGVYKVGDVVSYQGSYYVALQAHSANVSWIPPHTLLILWNKTNTQSTTTSTPTTTTTVRPPTTTTTTRPPTSQPTTPTVRPPTTTSSSSGMYMIPADTVHLVFGVVLGVGMTLLAKSR